MATKKDVFNAFYEGVCTVLSQTKHSGVNLNELDIDLDELKEFALENDHREIYDWAVSSAN